MPVPGPAGAAPAAAQRLQVNVAGVFPGKALLMIDGVPQTLAVGQSSGAGVKVLAIDGEQVTLEINGQRQQRRVGEQVASQATGDARSVAQLFADPQGHFFAQGSINGGAVRFLVDTGATMVSLGAAEARRLGIDPTRGRRGRSQTAAGMVTVWQVKLDTVKIGGVTMNNVDGLVHAHDLPVVLLGMSFLNRVEMQREGQVLTLKKRY